MVLSIGNGQLPRYRPRTVFDGPHSAPYNAKVVAVAAPCRNHPSREAIGICVRCRGRICGECATKIDGINHCVTCLAAAAGAGESNEPTPVRSAGTGASVAIAAGYAVVLGALLWATLEVLMPGRG